MPILNIYRNYLQWRNKKNQQEDSAFTCDKCRRYLLTANRSASLAHPYADLIAMSLIHLDLILQEKGYSPMTECLWNSFQEGID